MSLTGNNTRRLLIKSAMLHRGITGRELAARCNRSPALISAIISGAKRSKRCESIICKSLNLNRSDLWT